MTQKAKKIFLAVFVIVAAIISVDYYQYRKPKIIECKIAPIAELPTVERLLIRIRPASYLRRLSMDDQHLVEVNLWWVESRIWGSVPSAFFNAQNPLRELATAGTDDNYPSATAFEYSWLVSSTEVRIPSQDGHMHIFNSSNVKISREDGSYTEVIRDSRGNRDPRDEVTVHGMCQEAQAPASKPGKQLL